MPEFLFMTDLFTTEMSSPDQIRLEIASLQRTLSNYRSRMDSFQVFRYEGWIKQREQWLEWNIFGRMELEQKALDEVMEDLGITNYDIYALDPDIALSEGAVVE